MASDAEAVVLRALEGLGVRFERLDCDPGAADTAAFCERYGFDPGMVLNTILVVCKSTPRTHAACVVRASTALDVNRAVRRELLCPRASFAAAEEAERLTGMRIGGVTPFGLPGGMPLLIDAGVMTCAQVIVGGGGRSSKIRLSPEALRGLPSARIVPGLALERPAGPRA